MIAGHVFGRLGSRIVQCLAAMLTAACVGLAGAQSLVGAWVAGDPTAEGSSVIVFLRDGHFYRIQTWGPLQQYTTDDFAYLSYTWDPASGAFTGMDDYFNTEDQRATITGDRLRLADPYGAIDLVRVAGGNPIVGAWFLGNPAFAGDSGVVVFLPNGVYFLAQDSSARDVGGYRGIEHGTYAWDPATGDFTTATTPSPPYVDTNGPWGLSGPSGPRTLSVSPDNATLSIGAGGSSMALTRVSATAPPPPPPDPAPNFQGMWWSAPAGSESGWGINVAHQGDVIFATWFTYDHRVAGAGDLHPAWWLTMTAEKVGENVYAGTLSEHHGPGLGAAAFDPGLVYDTEVGFGTLTFSDPDNGRFDYTVNGVTQSKPITREVFGALPVCRWNAQPDLSLATNFQDLWWAAPAGVESGWGVNFTHQGDTIFATWFFYDDGGYGNVGAPRWLSAALHWTAPGVYTGALQETRGPPFDAVPFEPGKVVVANVGTLTVTFRNGNDAIFHYRLNLPGWPPSETVEDTKSITRQVFRPPGTACQ